MAADKLNAKDMLERTIKHIEEKYPNEINQCYKEIYDAADDCKFSTKIELISPVCAGTMKKYFLYKGYNARFIRSTLELAWNVNMDGNDINNILKERILLNTVI